jgi:uncharacterized membrane protein
MDTLLHPMLVHFPIALLITSVLFDVLGAWLTRESLREGALWLLVLGVLTGLAAFASGDVAAEAAEKAGVAESLIETHEHLAGATVGVFGALLVWRLLLRNRFSPRTRVAYLMVAIVGLGLLSATGHYGGSLVYEHGAGVNAAAARTAHLAETVSHR